MARKYFCDYCEKAFVDNPTSRRRHMTGPVHARNVHAHYAAIDGTSSARFLRARPRSGMALLTRAAGRPGHSGTQASGPAARKRRGAPARTLYERASVCSFAGAGQTHCGLTHVGTPANNQGCRSRRGPPPRVHHAPSRCRGRPRSAPGDGGGYAACAQSAFAPCTSRRWTRPPCQRTRRHPCGRCPSTSCAPCRASTGAERHSLCAQHS